MYNNEKDSITKGGVHVLFRKKIDRYCTYCQHAGKVDEQTMICQFYGLVPDTHRCRKFRYDPLKRVPGRQKLKQFEEFEEKDFSL